MPHDPPLVLVCPLEWGLGHATRCIPVIRAFMARGCRVVIAADGHPLALLKQEFGEQAGYRVLPGMKITYPERGCMAWKGMVQLLPMAVSLAREHRRLKKLLTEVDATLIVSDNRYGLFAQALPSVLITHQLFVRAPAGLRWMEPLLHRVVAFFVSKHFQCWVPDHAGQPNLSGDLSHRRPLRGCRFVGPLSRFPVQDPPAALPDDLPADYVLAMVSGPEPQREKLENKLREQLSAYPMAGVLIRGRADGHSVQREGSLLLIDHLPSARMQLLIAGARVVVCRSGYSTVMDLSVFGKKALMIPTPGQPEQEYLGQMLQENGWVACMDQEALCLDQGIEKALGMKGLPLSKGSEGRLSAAVEGVLRQLTINGSLSWQKPPQG